MASPRVARLAFVLLAACGGPMAPPTPKHAALVEAPPALTVGDILALQAIAPTPQQITVAQAQRDVDVLRYLLDRAYVGSLPMLGGLPRATVQELEAIRATPPLVPAELCRAIDAALVHVPDGHLRASLVAGQGCSRKPIVPNLIGRNLARAQGKTWVYEERRVADAPVGILAISGFDNRQLKTWDGFEAALESAARTQAVVVDLRGNGGGDPGRGYQLAGRLMNSSADNVAGEIRKIQRTTPEAYALAMNTCIELLGNGASEDRRAQLAREIDYDHDHLRKALAGGPESVSTAYTLGPALGPAPFPGRIAVLVDEVCESACETVAFALQGHPRTRLVGRQTQGVGHYSNAMFTNLPNSGIRVVVTEVAYELAEGRVFPEHEGLTPNIVIAPGEDALSLALAPIH